MKSTYIRFSLLIIIVHLTALSNSSSIIKNLPGFYGDLPFTLETGYVEVGDNNEVQFFYYFVESQRDPSHDPLLLYLTGGPGTPALYPFMYQRGPLTINLERSSRDNITLELNPNSWTKAANVIFLDLPAGVGFSYATTSEASRSGDSILALHAYEFLKKWLWEHPRFHNNPLYISGVSYMGILVPVVTLEAYKGNEQGNQPHLNIKGCLIVSPLTDKFSDFNSRLEFAHRHALISDDIYEGTVETWQQNNAELHYDLKKNDTIYYAYDIFSSIIYHKQLVERNCQVLIINGDHDMNFPYVGNMAWIASLNLPIETPWAPWFVRNQVAGYRMIYTKRQYSIMYATIKGAGHSVALYKPEEASVIVNGWLASHTYLSSDY